MSCFRPEDGNAFNQAKVTTDNNKYLELYLQGGIQEQILIYIGIAVIFYLAGLVLVVLREIYQV